MSLDPEVQETRIMATATTTDLSVTLAPVSQVAGGIVGHTLNEVSAATTPAEVGQALEKGAETAAEAAGGAIAGAVGAKLNKREKTVAGGIGLATLFFALAAGFTYVAVKAANKDDDKKGDKEDVVVVVPDTDDQ